MNSPRFLGSITLGNYFSCPQWQVYHSSHTERYAPIDSKYPHHPLIKPMTCDRGAVPDDDQSEIHLRYTLVMSGPKVNLSPKEKRAVKDFLASVRLAYGEKIQSAALFGSKVRGDSTEYSDIDILLVVTDGHWKFQQAITKISSEIALKYDVLLDVRIISTTRWKYYAEIQAGLYQNISRDAVPYTVRKKQSSLAG